MDLSVVIVNWKARDFLPTCLVSLKGNITGIEAEIIFVDNGSGDGSLEWVRSTHPDVKVMVNEGNLGFSKANNLAIERCKGAVILLLNPDTELKKGAVEALLSLLNENPTVGIVGPRLEYPDGTLYPQVKRAIPDIKGAFFYLFSWKSLGERFSSDIVYTIHTLDPDWVH